MGATYLLVFVISFYPATCDPKGHGSSTDIFYQITVQSPLFISMHRDRHPYSYRAVMLVRGVDLSHTNLVGTRAGMLVGGVMLIHSMLIYRVDCIYIYLVQKPILQYRELID